MQAKQTKGEVTMSGKPEQIVQKWAQRVADELLGEANPAQTARALRELQPLADLIRAARTFTDKWATGQVTMDEAIEMKAILDKLAGESDGKVNSQGCVSSGPRSQVSRTARMGQPLS